MDFSKQNELFQSLMEIMDNVKDKLKDSEYLKAMETLKGLKFNFEVFQRQFIPFAFLAVHENLLPKYSISILRSFILENVDEEVIQTAFSNCVHYMKSIGKPNFKKDLCKKLKLHNNAKCIWIHIRKLFCFESLNATKLNNEVLNIFTKCEIEPLADWDLDEIHRRLMDSFDPETNDVCLHDPVVQELLVDYLIGMAKHYAGGDVPLPDMPEDLLPLCGLGVM
jgi:hypothetical protein